MATLSVACEAVRDGIGQPTLLVTTGAFVVAGLAVLLGRPATVVERWPYGALVVLVGLGSAVQHGPHPWWQAYAHDVPLVAVLAFVAADALADLAGQPRRGWWWGLPTASAVGAVAVGADLSVALQAAVAAAAVVLSLFRAWARPAQRRRVLVALAVLAVGAAVGAVGDHAAVCRPESLLQGHALWHLLAAGALWWFAPAVGTRADTGIDGAQ